ncbi:bifunctional nitrate reductase/sulfite reductase flavoprotein subunit alpha [Deinococcus cellulosilyticus]|uniref:assimilatory sulfite reductase (NADPH) n=1 Tax=Deinococcus cellulosilyticus (strain DSM 18568 / NBRC 106333 / KACC 11606 / 5516J-15) TaxID=1223518 RepID=A0A511N6F0_DEIC1|nr:bifunctional nitrate reductase/sulfite reductase flavoprotein subunit alpha [Deinococcus cellulosilyticus]GEM48449.1 bifunctional reductase [Deinococcus cellulosilyticus NBRC 106333 = KACC 11606]
MTSPTKTVKTVCPYCGVGCGMLLTVENNTVTKVAGDPEHPANAGRLCTKGLTSFQVLNHPGRLTEALIRRSRYAERESTPMGEALQKTAKRIRQIIDTHGPDAFSFYLSGQISTEAQYLANKLAKGFIRTNNVETNSRLCMSSAAAGYKMSLGSDAPPGSYEDIENSDLFVVIGSNMADCHPILFLRVLDQVKARGAKLIVIDPKKTATADKADLFLPIKPGTDLAFLNGLLYLLIENHRIDRSFIREYTEGFQELAAFVQDYTPEKVSQITGIPEKVLRHTAKLIGEAREFMTFWTMGLNQSTHGTWHTNAIINLHLATGKICRTGSGPFSLTGQPNAMGGREVGYMSHALPGQRAIASAEDRAFVEKVWGVPEGTIPPKPGLDAVPMFEAMKDGKIKGVWVIGSNPVASMPNRQKVIDGLEESELVIVQDTFLESETGNFADILLPGALWAEAEGVMVNSERNVALTQKAVDAPGDALPDWQIIAEVAREMGYGEHFNYSSASDVFEEIKKTWNPRTGYDLRGITHDRLRESTVQWPCAPEGEKRNPIRYLNDGVSQSLLTLKDGTQPEFAFPTDTGKAKFLARPYLPPQELPDEEYSFVLNTGRLPHQWHTMTKTGKIPTLNKLNPEPFVEIHPDDAKTLGVKAGDQLEIRSRRGKAVLPAQITNRVQPGNLFAPIHWNDLFGEDLCINAVTNDAKDPISLQPELKFCAVALIKVEAEQRELVPVTAGKAEAVPAQAFATPVDALRSALGLREVVTVNFESHEESYLSGFLVGLGRSYSPQMPSVPTLPTNAPLTPTKRDWVNGLLAGMFSRGAPGTLPEPSYSTAQSILILYGSQTGNAEGIAQTLSDSLESQAVSTKVLSMSDFKVEGLQNEHTVILISSTYGDGDPPDNAKAFWDELTQYQGNLSHLKYAVLALGDSNYDSFCQFGKNLEARMAALSAVALHPRVDCDADYSGTSSTWTKQLTRILSGQKAPEPKAGSKPASSKYSKASPFPAKLVVNRRITAPGSEKDVRHFEFDLSGSGLTYEAGDALGIIPTNDPELVQEILLSLELTGKESVSVKDGEQRLFEALFRHYDIARPGTDFIQALAERTGDGKLRALLDPERKAELRDFLWGKQIADLLGMYRVKFSAAEFASLLKPLQSRLYSISSSPRLDPNRVSLTVSVVRYQGNGKIRKGVSSGFLADRAQVSPVPLFVQKNATFKLPKDQTAPVIMIGPGTGIAPFRAFLHDRQASGATGRNWLFFGEQRQNTDFLYQEELLALQQRGILHKLDTAFSRDQKEKVYVQHRMLEKAKELYGWMQDGAHIYICGDASRMAKDVDQTLQRILMQQGSMSEDSAREYLGTLGQQKRYLRDVY